MRTPILASLLLCATASADPISFVDVYLSQVFTQAGAGAPTLTGYYFSSNLHLQNQGDFTGATVTTPGGAINALSLSADGLAFGFSSPLFATLPAFNSAYPPGSYTFNASGGTSGPQTVATAPFATAYATAAPFLTNFSSLSSFNPANPFTFIWNAFGGALSGANTDSLIFFDIFNHTTGSLIYSAGFLPSGATSATVPGLTFQSNTAYDFQLVYSNRQLADNASGSAAFRSVLGSDLRTSGTFTTGSTATPEPASLFSMGLFVVGAMTVMRRRV